MINNNLLLVPIIFARKWLLNYTVNAYFIQQNKFDPPITLKYKN